ncbi:SDR family NAD(P)-dependent oxidoreductase [Salinisphaera sp.]|uniref:SDR family NAD(P)-dependent oxidoreductase n=1 Tax=Salinisphaera sp. TaxID=1914330 RepID=UPI002D798D41|nr:SDR family NAD(P)-dependent oxidoreductase [Salinisphaera sp.]HET7315179.1 SDR family NAD(P)-dependent oxidoreductase [Salinisphaera sp.]
MRFADKYGPWALVTGASSGIGEAFARQIAARGVNVALVARRAERLAALAADIEAESQARALAIPADLRADDCLDTIAAALDLRHIGLLVNNAGVGQTGRFLDHDLDDELATLALNCRAPLKLTHHFGRAMRDQKSGGIIMVSSIVGILPTPEFAGYSATKAWNRFLGESLHEELADDGIDVVSLCPGLTESEFFGKVDFDPSGWPGPLKAGTILSTEDVARAALRGLGRTTQVVPGFSYRWLMRAGRLAPSGLPPWLGKRVMHLALPKL